MNDTCKKCRTRKTYFGMRFWYNKLISIGRLELVGNITNMLSSFSWPLYHIN